MKNIIIVVTLMLCLALISISYFVISSNIEKSINEQDNYLNKLLKDKKTQLFIKENLLKEKDNQLLAKDKLIEAANTKIKNLKNSELLAKKNTSSDKDNQLLAKDKLIDAAKELEKNLKEQVEATQKKLDEVNGKLIDLVNDKSLFFHHSEKINILNSKFNLTKYTNSYLKNTGPRAYFESYKDNLILVTGTGTILYSPFDQITNNGFELIRIKSNFRDFVSEKYLHNRKSIITNILVKNDKIYLSYIKKINDDCFVNSLIVSDLNFSNVNFKEFFDSKECTLDYEIAVGGNIVNYKDNKILMTIGDWHSYEKYNNTNPQNINSILGKIISIDILTKEYKILSMGHRNQQGLFYDNTNDVIFSAEHGPQGGDEVNINIRPEDGKVKNYGWALSSYGDHYGYPERNNEELYKIAPLHKSHLDYNFIEPLKNFTPSIGMSQVIKTEEFTKLDKGHVAYVAAMGNDISEGDMSIHQLILDEEFKLIEHNIISIGERIRDMKYIKSLDVILLFLETSGSIGILNTNFK